MKILITGFTGLQANAGSGQLGIISNISSIARALEDLGHEVTWRPVEPGESLDEFEKCIVSINGVASWVSPYALGGLYVIGKRKDAIFTVDDWQANKAWCGGPEKEGNVVWNPKLNRAGHEGAFNDPAIKSVIDEAVFELCYKHHRKMLIPTLPNPDLELLGFGAHNAVAYDPSSYMNIYEYNICFEEKQSRWVCASLADKPSWFKRQRFTWPIDHYGIRKLGQPRVPEAQLAQIYSDAWGIISPAHPHAGSGWFRVRFYMAAKAGSIIFCSPEEGRPLGDAYVNTASAIEAMSSSELLDLAKYQQCTLQDRLWDREQLQKFIKTYLELSDA